MTTERSEDLEERAMEKPVCSLKADACPLCGGPNGCAASACGSVDVECWCAAVRIDEAVLARLPEALRGRACVCRRCIQSAGEA